MRPLRPALALLLIAAPAAFSQSSQARPVDDDDAFVRRLEAEIDRILTAFGSGLNRWEAADTLDRKPRSKMRTADLSGEGYAHSFTGDTRIDEGETIGGNVVVKGGDLTILGTVDGDVLVVGGTLYVKDGGRVTGNARVINGSIVRSEGGTIEGYEERSAAAAGYRADRGRFRRSGTSFDVPWRNEFSNLDNVVLRYNRVEGLFFGLASDKKFYWDGRRSWTAFGSAGWGFRSHTWRYNLGLARQIPLVAEGSQLIEIGVEGYSLTDSKDKWIIGTNENSAAAFFIHEDFLDYYGRRGFTGHVGWLTQGSYVRSEVSVGYSADRYDSLNNRTDWALFGGRKRFRLNPPVTPGDMRSVNVQASLTTLEKTSRGPEGWAVTATAELGRRITGSDFSFSQYTGDLRRYQPLGRYDNFNIRLRVGTSDGFLPPQRLFEIGGLGTLGGYGYKCAAGNRLVLVNSEYIVDGNFLDDLDFWPADMLGGVNFLFLSDAGVIRTVLPKANPEEGFANIRWGEFRHNFGVGFANRSGSLRVTYNWRTDAKAPGVFMFRFVRPF